MRVHNLKIWPKYLHDIMLGIKKIEIRKNDRDFQEGDLLHFQEWHPLKQVYTGLTIDMRIDYILSDVAGLEPDYVILQISKPI